ncbi:MAG: CapA family protein [Anaerolineaceae bacterium]
MKHFINRSVYIVLIISILLSGCTTKNVSVNIVEPTPNEISPTPTEISIPTLWVDVVIPAALKEKLIGAKLIKLVQDNNSADLKFELVLNSDKAANNLGQVQWIYALEAPFPTVADNLSVNELKNLWLGTIDDTLPVDKLQVSSETKGIFNAIWGQASDNTVEVLPEDKFTSNDFKSLKTWAIVPFEQISPRWKVILIDGINPLDKPLDTAMYSLKADFVISGILDGEAQLSIAKELMKLLPATNRDESKLTVLMMTGTTAMVRATAYKMEIKGLDYPILEIKDWFKNADLIHVSNEVAFNPDCPYPDPNGGMRMCSSPKYLQTLKDLGVNVVELTGNHENDYGPENFAATIDAYKELGWYTFGGGKTPAEAQAPAKVEANGNKIAFIGCNPEGPKSDWASETQAGSATCDMSYISQQISDLKSQGYVVITTFQQFEVYNTYIYGEELASVYRDAANAGADIVSGSEAHFAMGFQFIGNNIIHFGLGNFLFDQMAYQGVPADNIRREFIDRHIIYNGKYINTQLLTAELVDWAQPTPMDNDQRSAFLTDVFNGSMWSETK